MHNFSVNAVVDKPGVVAGDIRLINDYSYPPDASVNDYTYRSDHPSISYNPPRAIARRIDRLKKSNPSTIVLLMLGDVTGAFRHIPIHAASVHMFCFRYENFLVIDLSCGFGWCGSPAYYAVAGKLINQLYEFSNHRTRQLRGNVCCDDHTCVETDAGTRSFDANLSLRRAMDTMLGSSAINEQKFTAWSTKNKVLGLLWDTEAGCVSIPADTISRALGRIRHLIAATSATKSELRQLIGSLRHVASCSRPARAFFQRLQPTANSSRQFGSQPLTPDAFEDLRRFRSVLQQPDRFNAIPGAQIADLAKPDIDVYMDASGEGLCVLEPTRQNRSTVRRSLSAMGTMLLSHVLARSTNVKRSEYLVTGTTRHFFPLKTRNTFFSDADGKKTRFSLATSVTIGLEGAKNDQYGRGAWRTMHASGDKLICPGKALYHVKRARRELVISSPHLCAKDEEVNEYEGSKAGGYVFGDDRDASDETRVSAGRSGAPRPVNRNLAGEFDKMAKPEPARDDSGSANEVSDKQPAGETAIRKLHGNRPPMNSSTPAANRVIGRILDQMMESNDFIRQFTLKAVRQALWVELSGELA
ncbi:unnamed protein product [Phytophthora fragariaefolia]|uniref:Unnamed protein product n=1 Tax=Phytophthora fragariaefolia TaxID=1490495 RepID=A0A9W6U0S6_9STRA|nr:unnamed protein product [Phytophthora fragariaefolia]